MEKAFAPADKYSTESEMKKKYMKDYSKYLTLLRSSEKIKCTFQP